MGDAAEKLAPVPAAPSTTEQVRARGIGGLITHAELAWVAGFPASVLVLLGVSAALRRSSTR